jgi:hypothetical protein
MKRPKRKPEPYQWTRQSGPLKAWQLRHYARWLFPQLKRKWEAAGVVDFTLPADQARQPEPYQFPKSTGVMLLRHLRHFADYAFKALEPESDKQPYQWPRSSGLAFVADLKHLHRHLQAVLKTQRESSN